MTIIAPHSEPSTVPLDTTDLRARHTKVVGDSVEPDPVNPDGWRQTAYCAFCAEHRPDEDMRWPCETMTLLDAVEEKERLTEAASALLSITATFMPERAACGHDRRWLLSLLDGLRAALPAEAPSDG
jgi:hypothetical protein